MAATSPCAAPTETDYLIVGAGAMGMAFADEVFHALPEARITLVDRRAKPGGHWNDAYPYVTLHQPAAFYGVNSAPLGAGGGHLSSRSELLAYFERLMDRFLASGRVEFLAKSEYLGGGRIASTLDPDRVRELAVRRRTVDATYMGVEVPATHPPRYDVDPEVALVPPNALARIEEPWERYVIVGAGKTGGDAVVFLRDSGVEPERIRWIVSEDMWMWNRACVQPETAGDELVGQMETLSRCATPDEAFLELERRGSVFRLNQAVLPRKWRCATFDRRELALLRSVSDVVRAGRVERIGADEIGLTGGTIPNGRRDLIVDCTANGLAGREPRPIFEPGAITLQSLWMCQQVFSAAMIAHLEAMDLDDDERNAMVQVVPHPESTADWPGALVATFRNLIDALPAMPGWLLTSRLNALSHEARHRVVAHGLRARRVYPQARSSAERMLAAAG